MDSSRIARLRGRGLRAGDVRGREGARHTADHDVDARDLPRFERALERRAQLRGRLDARTVAAHALDHPIVAERPQLHADRPVIERRLELRSVPTRALKMELT